MVAGLVIIRLWALYPAALSNLKGIVDEHELPSGTTIPDARWINRHIDVREVAKLLGIRRAPANFHCWMPEKHRNEDRNPSVGYWRAGNRLKCFVCDFPAAGPIDIVMRVLGLDFGKAVKWVASQFPGIPSIPTRKPTDKTRPRNLDGILDPMSYLVRTHIYAKLCMPTRCVAAALIALSDRGELTGSPRTGRISYTALKRYSGVRSSTSIRKAVEELAVIGWMKYTPKTSTHVTRAVNQYVLTPFSDEIRALGDEIANDEQAEIRYERQLAKERRIERENTFIHRTSSQRKIISSPNGPIKTQSIHVVDRVVY